MSTTAKQLVDEYNEKRERLDAANREREAMHSALAEITKLIAQEMTNTRPGDIVVAGGVRYRVHWISASEVPGQPNKWVVRLAGYKLSAKGKQIGKNAHGIFGEWEKEKSDGN